MAENIAHFSDCAAAEQVSNRVRTEFDQTQAYVSIESFSSGWREADRLDVSLLRGLCRLSAEHPEQVQAGFTSMEVVEAISEVRGRPWSTPGDKDKMSDDVRRLWKKLLETWEQKHEGVKQKLWDEGLACQPALAKTEGGGTGNTSRYRVELQVGPAIPESRPGRAEEFVATGGGSSIRYVCEDIEDANIFARIFTRGYDLHGWRRGLYLVALATPLLFGWLLFALTAISFVVVEAIGAKSVLTSVFVLATFFYVVMATTGRLYTLPAKRIVLAPWWMQSIDDDRLLEHRRPPRHDRRSVKAVRYTSRCPVCGGQVTAKAGGVEFWGRIVGRCEEAPAEHVFSFDHISRAGFTLRSPMVCKNDRRDAA